MIFTRDHLRNKQNYYLTLIIVEIVTYLTLIFLKIPWYITVLIFPFLIIEIISNLRCLNRQKNFIKALEFHKDKLICTHINNSKTLIDFDDLLYSFREIKFEKDKSEIEIKTKGKIRNKRIGRIHINDWKNIFEVKDELLKNGIIRVQFKPEGFWNKYGGLTADVVLTTSALTINEIGESEIANNIAFSSDFNSLHKNHKNKASDS